MKFIVFSCDFQLFSVICDQTLIDATKHGFMSIEIWQRDTDHKIESLVGSAKVPLHQFYIAFNNNIIRNHVSKQEVNFCLSVFLTIICRNDVLVLLLFWFQ